ncbi:MAG: PAS-domain containing protein, partial [Aestuariivirga sp.]
MRKSVIKRDTEGPQRSGLETLAKLNAASRDFLERDQQATIADLKAQALRYETAIDKISQGVCFFDGQERLILSNRRYAEIYHLAADDLIPGTTLREIVKRRSEVGTSPMAVEDYLAWRASINSDTEASNSTVELKDGRTIHIVHQPMPDGGWVATHEDITELKAKRALANERISLQTLIDWVPEYLWVKDTQSRFVLINKCLATDIGRVGPKDMLGLSDVEIHGTEMAREFFACEQRLMRTGEPMIDKEELVVDAKGNEKWLLSTKVPLRDDKGVIFGLVGIARDITERKRADALRNEQAQILEMIALSVPLVEVLDRLMRLVESQLNGIFGSVLLLDQDGEHLRHGAAPSMAEAYIKAIDGARIGPKVGSCGTAVYRRAPVIVSDIMTDPLWEDYHGLASPYGYRSCWSTPILSHEGAVLGVFAMYSRSVREPSANETRH